jgi:V-type H+-transporting ATPase subunit E
MYQLLEPAVNVQCRQKDLALVNDAVTLAKQEYEKTTNHQIKVSVTPELNDSCGGIVVQTPDGRIRSKNTLENRLDLLADKMLPDIRIMLFGPSTNRAFYN